MLGKILIGVLLLVAGSIIGPMIGNTGPEPIDTTGIIEQITAIQREASMQTQTAIAGDDSSYVGTSLVILLAVLVLVPFGWLFATRYLDNRKPAVAESEGTTIRDLIRYLQAERGRHSLMDDPTRDQPLPED